MIKKIAKSYRVELRAFNRVDETNCGGYIGVAMGRFGKRPGTILAEAVDLYKSICEKMGNKAPKPWATITYNDYVTPNGTKKSDVQVVRTFSLEPQTIKSIKWLMWCSYDVDEGKEISSAKVITQALWWYDAATYKPDGAGTGVWELHSAAEMVEMLHDASKRKKLKSRKKTKNVTQSSIGFTDSTA